MKINSIAIEISGKAFLPEAYAYRKAFIEKGYYCNFLSKDSKDILNYDAVLLFHGFHPFWKKYPDFVIGEYHSLSTGRFPRVKDFIKKIINIRPNIYIFLNNDVKDKMWHFNKSNFVIRGMGYEKNDFEKFRNEEKKYDVVYCGSYRDGLDAVISKLAKLQLKIAVVGTHDFCNFENVSFLGKLPPCEARRVIMQAEFGLNFTPDIFPFNIQDSTKIIEYCGAGLKIITNKYKWVNEFEEDRGGNFLDLDKIDTINNIIEFDFKTPNVDDLAWDRIIDKSKIFEKIIYGK